MTKVEAIVSLMKDNGGVASWQHIYDSIEKYYPEGKSSKEWQAGLRGVLYREIRNGKTFKKVGLGIFALKDYSEEQDLVEIKTDAIRMHSYVEGQLIEIGNQESYETYCADPSMKFRPGVPLGDLVSIKSFPEFTYDDLSKIIRRIDVIYFGKGQHKFPKRAFEVVDSIGTLQGALDRFFKLKEFQTELFLVTPSGHVPKILTILEHDPYLQLKDRIIIKTYEEIENLHQRLIDLERYKF